MLIHDADVMHSNDAIHLFLRTVYRGNFTCIVSKFAPQKSFQIQFGKKLYRYLCRTTYKIWLLYKYYGYKVNPLRPVSQLLIMTVSDQDYKNGHI